MDPRPRAALAVCLGAVGFLAADFLVSAVRMPVLWYLPIERRFEFQTFGGGAAMDFYGRLLWCVLAGLAIAAVASWRLPALDEVAVGRWERRTIVWLGLMLVLAGALHVTQLVGRNPVPLELP